MRKESIIIGAMVMLVTYTLGLSFVSQAYPAGQASTTFSSTGSIQIQSSAGIGVYQYPGTGIPLTSATWGTLEPGESQTITCYIKNEGNSNTILSLESSNWYPQNAVNYLSLDWNYNGTPIIPEEERQIILTLSVDTNIVGIENFGFDITIVGSV